MVPDLLLVLGRLLQGVLQPLELLGRVGQVAGGFVGAVVEDGVEADQAKARLHPLGVVASCRNSTLGEWTRRRTAGLGRRPAPPHL